MTNGTCIWLSQPPSRDQFGSLAYLPTPNSKVGAFKGIMVRDGGGRGRNQARPWLTKVKVAVIEEVCDSWDLDGPMEHMCACGYV